MSSSDEKSVVDEHAQAEAQRAADGLKDQIAALRARIQDAKRTLKEHVRREREPRSFRK
jgi:hypothetical protein